jgi:Fe-S cluster assembly protein SufD
MSAPMTNNRQSIPAPLSQFQQHALVLAEQQVMSDGQALMLGNLRQQSADDFKRATWPGRKVEHWKYTSVQSLKAYESAGWAAVSELPDDFMTERLMPLNATRLVFVDGSLDAAASDPVPEGISLFSEADTHASQLIETHLGKIAGSVDPSRRNLFAALNGAWTDEGLLIHVTQNALLEKPIYLVYVSTGDTAIANLRTLLILEQGANAHVIEHFLSVGSYPLESDPAVINQSDSGFVNALTEIHLGQNAQLNHTRLNLEHETATHVGAVHVNLMRDAVFNGFTLAEGSKLKRLDYQLNHCGQGASLNFDGVYLARHNQLVDFHTCIEHRVPHCTSQQVFRGIVGDKAKAVFNGRIHIFENAQKTLAEMSNRNLLTSNTAEINTKPELEIYADDVKCAHGATITQLDETALYYLQSRGVSPSQARMMLSFGFINALLSAQSIEDVKVWLEAWLRGRFSEDRSLISDIKTPVNTGADL